MREQAPVSRVALATLLIAGLFLAGLSIGGAPRETPPVRPSAGGLAAVHPELVHPSDNATGNLTAALNRVLFLTGLVSGAVVTLVWVRVALSWFSHDPTRKVQAKERARDALLGSLVLLAAVTGLAWGLAHWVLTGV